MSNDLEAERDFLLRSLEDLDSELATGNIDPDTYRVLHDDYTARASAVIQSIADSNAPQSRAIRDDIPRRIAAGQSDAEIRAYYVSRYTERILETPSNSGLGIVAWGLPAVAIILGSASIVIAVRRWSRTPRLAATDADEDIVRRAREDAGDEDEDGG